MAENDDRTYQHRGSPSRACWKGRRAVSKSREESRVEGHGWACVVAGTEGHTKTIVPVRAEVSQIV